MDSHIDKTIISGLWYNNFENDNFKVTSLVLGPGENGKFKLVTPEKQDLHNT